MDTNKVSPKPPSTTKTPSAEFRWKTPKYARVEPGVYDATVKAVIAPEWSGRYKRWIVKVVFKLPDGQEVTLFVNMGSDPADPSIAPNSNYQKWWTAANGAPPRDDEELRPDVFMRGQIFRVEVTAAEAYSKVTAIVAVNPHEVESELEGEGEGELEDEAELEGDLNTKTSGSNSGSLSPSPSPSSSPNKERVLSPPAASEPKAIVLNNVSPTAQSASADDSLTFHEALSQSASSFQDENHWELSAYLEFWNAACPRFKRAQVTDRRVAKLQTLIGDGMTTQGFMEAVRKAVSSELCKRHRLTFEWFISDHNWRDGRFVCAYLNNC
ncbi:hypothetical protein [Tunturiibacter gelidoferens]|uniref:Uncharacterized protein n=1 Tax=Tunturiibacter gelidiferens TaxID=3069689 RepID=A0A9X0U4B1_9BACT|nr:hypothetical protein [Edaphobacter lichenicola]MBB5329199.1 hypothetical protein [Edaphobacter lichenicola]